MNTRNKELIAAIEANDLSAVEGVITEGADVNGRQEGTGLNPLMIAAGYGHPEIVERLLEAGADVHTIDPLAGSSALHKACQGGSLPVVRLLVEAGAPVDLQTSTTGHSPLIEAMWFKWPDVVEYLLEQNAGLNLNTHYGFTLADHLNYVLKADVIGLERLQKINNLVAQRRSSDQQKVKDQKLMTAVSEGNVEAAQTLIEEGANIEARYPVLNGFNDAHTPLLVACREGHAEIVRLLLEAGAEVNVTEPTFGAVPLHKATYNGHVEITRMLAQRSGVNLDYQGPSNGYTPLHDALWHGYRDCSKILIDAGARLDIRAHDGKLPVEIADDQFGEDDEMVAYIRSRMV